MTLRQLEILRALVRHRTTVAAAAALRLSQPAVSNALRQMETQAGFALFERINNRLFPTREALLLHEQAEGILALHAGLENRLVDLRESTAGHLRLVSTPPLGHGVIPAVLRSFLARRPQVRVLLDVRPFEGVTDSLENGLTDLGFMLGEDDTAALTKETLHSADMVCVMPQGHALARRDVVTPADLAPHAFIALERGTRMGEAVRESFRQVDCPFAATVETRYCNTACVLAEAGVGVAVVDPFSPVSGTTRRLEIRPFAPATRSVAYAAWSPNRALSRLAKAFLDEVRRAMPQGAMEPSLARPAPAGG
jgi:DNA-binding transcriptional LysR family regulator